MILVLALVVPVVFAAGLLARRPIDTVDRLPFAPDLQPADSRQLHDDLAGVAVRVSHHPGNTLRVELLRDPRRPELLVYWSVRSGEALPPDAYLLGPVRPERAASFTLPEMAADRPGHLFFYSLTQSELVDSFALKRPTENQDGA